MGNCELRPLFGHLGRKELMVNPTQVANLRAAWVLFLKFNIFIAGGINVNSIIISKYALIREGLRSILSRYNNMKINLASESVKETVVLIKEDEIDMVFLDLNEGNKEELLLIKELKESGVRSKFVILDFNNNKKLFVEAIRCGVEGYILGKSSEMEILHIIEEINRGKKYYDACFIDSIINENDAEPGGLSELTAREKEILCEIGKGMSNGMISKKFFISENTVKKHVNHIFDKLNMKDRTQAALYAIRCGLVKRDAS
jgi:DNA-binding NarL/FixJ family response regulator